MVNVSSQNHFVVAVILARGSVVVEHVTRVTTGHTHNRGADISLRGARNNTQYSGAVVFCQNSWIWTNEFGKSELKLYRLSKKYSHRNGRAINSRCLQQ